METIIDFADRIGSKIIGEGIEKQEELQILLSMGMDYGQGFFLARPTPHGSELNNEITSVQKRHSKIEKKSADKPSVRSLIHKVQTVAPDAPSKEIYRHFDENSQEKSVVLTDNKQPVGLVMRHTLHEKLSGNMGQSLYWKRPVRKIADEEPLIVSEKANVHQVSQIITENDSRNIDQDVIVVEDETGRYLGNLSIKTLLEKITNLKTQKARRANPLTGLPGNIEIRDRIRRNLNHDRTFTLIYVDLDHFKPFNDYYGFERGDEAILSLKNLLSDGMEVYPSPMNFLGHIGGDDFVAITSTQHVQDYCEYVIDQFDDRIRELYDPDDLQDGFIKTKNRQRESQKFNIMTVSLAVVTNQDRSFENHLEMSEVAAEMKQYVKQNREKSSYAIDRRQSG